MPKCCHLLHKGLTVVDVYSDWSGPCSAMTNFLKKVKLEVNDDLLSYAMAKTDNIPQLKVRIYLAKDVLNILNSLTFRFLLVTASPSGCSSRRGRP